MELSLFLARLFGIYLLIVSALWVVRREALTATVEEFLASRSHMFLSGLLALVVGIAMVISHSVWAWNWRGLITLLGYLSLAKGIARVGFPDVPRVIAGYVLKDSRLWLWIGLVFVLGAYLTWSGFTAG